MSSFRKLRLILWKNWLFRRRHFIMTFLELIFPPLVALGLYLLREEGGEDFKVKYNPDFTAAPDPIDIMGDTNDKDGVSGKSNLSMARLGERFYILYTPKHAERLLEGVRNLMGMGNVVFQGVATEQVINSWIATPRSEKKVIAAFVFTGLKNNDDLFNKNLVYKIRIGDTLNRWDTDKIERFDMQPPLGENAYQIYGSFMVFQHLIAVKVVEVKARVENVTEQFKITTQEFIFPPHYEGDWFNTNVLINFLPLFLTLAYIFTAPITVRRIVGEKQNGIKEFMKLMGIPAWIQWVGWFITTFIMMTISAALMAIILCLIHTSAGISVLIKSAPEIFFIILLFYIPAAIAFCFFIATLFKRPTVAAAFTILAWLLSFCIPYYTYLNKYHLLIKRDKLLFALLPNMALAWAIRNIVDLESRNEGIQWNNLHKEGLFTNDLSMLSILLMMIIDLVIYLLMMWYIGSVFPGNFGIPKKWYFPCTPSYWNCKLKSKGLQGVEKAQTNPNKFDTEPNLEPKIIIKNLFKSYGWSGSYVVTNLSLNVYKDEITALLGHNGAGKTTTMSILTGMFPPTEGTAYISGYNIKNEMDKIRNDLGLCPQTNMLFDNLTVLEHLKFFGKLKLIPNKQLKIEIRILLRKLQLESVEKKLSKNLSGGMKRKLHLGISLIGNPSVVMLDEPTSGMDPEARRAIWDLLQEYRNGRCILLTTHFMEEADVLGDRIAIMSNGQIECCGSPLYLKKKFGAGYHLILNVNPDDVNLKDVTDVIRRYISTSYLESNKKSELSYILPSDQTKKFADLFKYLEENAIKLGIKSFGLSVTTMEEVFLKVGKIAQVGETDKRSSALIRLKSESSRMLASRKRKGIATKGKQLYGLILKRLFYARHRYFILIAMIVVPVLAVIVLILINNAVIPNQIYHARTLNLEEYPESETFIQYDTRSKNFSSRFESFLSSQSKVKGVKNAIEYVKEVGQKEFSKFRSHLILGAIVIQDESKTNVRLLFNNFYYHTPAIALNALHNAMLQYYSGTTDLSLTVVNEPFQTGESTDGGQSGSGLPVPLARGIIICVFMPIPLSILGASFIEFPLQDRVSKCKKLQFMTGINGLIFWFASFLWDFIICLICFSIMILMFYLIDTTTTFYSECLGLMFLVLVLYAWAAIPFAYLLSYMFKTAAVGFTVITVVSITVSLTIGLWNYVVTLMDLYYNWHRLFSILPTYSAVCALAKIVVIASKNNVCRAMDPNILETDCKETFIPIDTRKCCPDCGSHCFKEEPYFKKEHATDDLVALFVAGIIYFVFICLFELPLFRRICQMVYKGCCGRKHGKVLRFQQLEEDVLAEKKRVINMKSGSARTDVLLVNNLTKRFGRFTAVDGITFGVANGSCFGLLGVNGAGKTSTFRMLIGDLFVTAGDASISQFSLRKNFGKYIANIGYCPQFDALLTHVTGKELLRIFANLQGVSGDEMKKTIDDAIMNFDLTEHANKLIKNYSGGNKRKLSAALAFMGEPVVVFLDEPTTGVDPIARRKIWTMISRCNRRGIAVVLTSHSMEECEVLCSRVGIMVGGQFQCFGGIQYLKNKFSQGFTILAKVKRYVFSSYEEEERNQMELQRFIERKFASAVLKDVHQGMIQYQVTDKKTKLTDLFKTMEEAKERFKLEDYSVSQSSLEQVFLSFARV